MAEISLGELINEFHVRFAEEREAAPSNKFSGPSWGQFAALKIRPLVEQGEGRLLAGALLIAHAGDAEKAYAAAGAAFLMEQGLTDDSWRAASDILARGLQRGRSRRLD
jgi:hypothetical protein